MRAVILVLCLSAIAAAQSVETRLREIPALNEARLEAYAGEKPPLPELIRAWTSTDADLAHKAAIVLSFLGEPARSAILSAKPALPEQRVWAVRTLIDSAKRPTPRIARRLDTILADCAPVPEHGRRGEEAPPPQRVCDQVYTAVLAWVNGLTQAVMLKQRAFSRQSEPRRDAEIRVFRQSVRWRAILR